MTYDAVIIGGGVSGLAAAYELKRRGHNISVLERQHHAGGNAISERIGGFLMEHGPSTVNTLSPTANDFSRALGINDQRVELGENVRKRYLVDDGGLCGIPVHPLGFLMSGYLSPMARLRMMAEIAIPRNSGDEETVSEFCTRRFGAEFTDRVIDPLVGGIYSGVASELSMDSVFPKLGAMENKYGSITAGLLASRWRGGKMPGSRLFSWAEGIGTLPRILAARLGRAVQTGVTVLRIRRSGDGFRIETANAGTLRTRTIIIATQPHVAAGLLEGVEVEAAEAAGGVDAPPLAVVFFGFRRNQVEHPLDGLGFLSAQDEKRRLIGAQFVSTMFEGRSPEDHVCMSGYIGGDRAPGLAQLGADDLIELAREEFGDLVGARGKPVIAQVRHWPRGLPQYRMGHGSRKKKLETVSERCPGLFITGNYFAGPSVSACLEQATGTALQTSSYLAAGKVDLQMVAG